MKKIVLFLCLCCQITAAQQVNQCGIVIPPASLTSNFLNVYEAGKYIRTILDSVNWQANFSIQEQNGINNAYATIIRNRRYIVYDNKFLSNLDQYARTSWASVSVLAHEMGHHYYNHLLSGNSSPSKELEADYFSGYALAKMGVSLNEATAAMQRISPVEGSVTHPPRASRVNAIQQGWNYAKGINTTATTAPRPPVPQPQQNPPPPASSTAGWIHLSLYGNNSMTVFLSDDGSNYSPVLLKTTQPFVFKYEIYNYGFLRLTNSPAATTYKLTHNKDYSIIWNRRTNNWTVVQVP